MTVVGGRRRRAAGRGDEVEESGRSLAGSSSIVGPRGKGGFRGKIGEGERGVSIGVLQMASGHEVGVRSCLVDRWSSAHSAALMTAALKSPVSTRRQAGEQKRSQLSSPRGFGLVMNMA